MKPAIEIRNLGKEYKIAASQRYIALRDVLAGSVKNLFSPSKNKNEKFWALKDINLDIMPGERVGIIGRNGAGKSTLLKIISRITPPTTGEAIIYGRVGSLLEVGTGFHPELTGRENIYLNGSILGLKRNEINKQFDAIVDFSGVEKFIDTPLKHFSSGMQLRLAFAVAAHLEPEILLIDEVLAVGDMEFQKKCIGKMEEVSKEHGRTIVFVSHDMQSISTLTEKVIYLKDGKVVYYGSTANAIQAYISDFNLKKSVYTRQATGNMPCITKVEIITSLLNSVQENGKAMKINIEVDMPEADIEGIAIAVQVKDIRNRSVIHLSAFDHERPICRGKGKNKVRFTIPNMRTYMGKYVLDVHMSQRPSLNKYETIIDICPFEISMYEKEHGYRWTPNMCVYLEDYYYKGY
jgi:lipopolysaccharide transport system ATP-binding protein